MHGMLQYIRHVYFSSSGLTKLGRCQRKQRSKFHELTHDLWRLGMFL